jgi:hypothetical protein
MDIRLAGAIDGVATLDRSSLRARMHKLGIQKP